MALCAGCVGLPLTVAVYELAGGLPGAMVGVICLIVLMEFDRRQDVRRGLRKR